MDRTALITAQPFDVRILANGRDIGDKSPVVQVQYHADGIGSRTLRDGSVVEVPEPAAEPDPGRRAGGQLPLGGGRTERPALPQSRHRHRRGIPPTAPRPVTGEPAMKIDVEAALVLCAQGGELLALEAVLRRIQTPLYNLAVRPIRHLCNDLNWAEAARRSNDHDTAHRSVDSTSTYPMGWQTRTDIELRDGTQSLRARPGDLLLSDAGTVWGTADGQWQDILLLPGQSHRMDVDAIVHASALGPARLPCSPTAVALPTRPGPVDRRPVAPGAPRA
jgi:hypothetical protein